MKIVIFQFANCWFTRPIGSMVLLDTVTWIPSIYPLYVSIYTSTMDPMGEGVNSFSRPGSAHLLGF